MVKRNIGENIKKYRILANMSQLELANYLNVSDKTISSWERNRTEPRMGDVERMAIRFNCKKTDLLGIITSPLVYTPDIQEVITLYFKLNDEQKESVLNTMKLFAQLNENH